MKTVARTGERIGVYKIIRQLGQGGMGAVYEALDTTLDRHIALKIVQPAEHYHGEDADRAIHMFQREAKLAARLNHPNVVTVHALNVIDDAVLIAMELVEGDSIAALIARGRRWHPQSAANLLMGIASGVAAAHAQGIVHRDLTPNNVMITPNGTPKVLDFGIARRLEGEDAPVTSEEGPTFGTINYMAPEQITNGPTGPWTDVFAIGAIGYEAITGIPAFGEGEPITVGMRVTSETPPLLADPELANEFFGPLAGILKRSLAKEHDVRFTDAAKMALALSMVSTSPESSPARKLIELQQAGPPREKPEVETKPIERKPSNNPVLVRLRALFEPIRPVVGKAKLSVYPRLDRVAMAIFGNRAAKKWLPSEGLPTAVTRRLTMLGAGIILTLMVTSIAVIARVRSQQSTTVPVSPLHVLPPNADITVVGPAQHPLLGTRIGPTNWHILTGDSVLLRFANTGFAPQEHWFSGLPILVELQQLPRQSCGVVQAEPEGTRITAEDSTQRPAETSAVLCVGDDDSMLVSLTHPGYEAQSVWFDGTDLQVQLETRSVPVQFRANVPATVSVLTPNSQPVVSERATPFNTTMTPGRYNVQFQADGFPTWDSVYVVRPTTQNLVIRRQYPTATTGVLRIWVEGGWARVSVDGGPSRLTATTFTDLTVGDHVLELSRPGRQSKIDTVFVRALNAPADTTRVRYTQDLTERTIR